jgi:hypothetical protein
MREKNSRRGSYLIGVLIAVAILMILSMGYFRKGKCGAKSARDSAMDLTHKMDCANSRNKLKGDVLDFTRKNPGMEITEENLRMSGKQIPECRSGGTYQFEPNGEIHCTVHSMPPPTATPAPAVDFLSSSEPEVTPTAVVDFLK